MLEALLRASPGALSAERLLEQAWDENADPFTNTVTVTIGRLRRKLGEPEIIQNDTRHRIPHHRHRQPRRSRKARVTISSARGKRDIAGSTRRLGSRVPAARSSATRREHRGRSAATGAVWARLIARWTTTAIGQIGSCDRTVGMWLVRRQIDQESRSALTEVHLA